MMYRCKNDHVFSRYKVKGYDASCGWEDQVCPVCETDEFDEVYHCIKCGEWYTSLVGSICEGCIAKRVNRANAYLYAMRNNDDPAIIDGMNGQQIRVYCLEDQYDFSEFLEGQDD